MTPALRDAVLWSAITLAAASVNLSTGTACGRKKLDTTGKAYWRRALVGPIGESEPNDEPRLATNLVEARLETRTRFHGVCVAGNPDFFRTSVAPGYKGLHAEIGGDPTAVAGAMLRAPDLGLEARLRGDSVDLEIPAGADRGMHTSVVLEIPCARAGAYAGWITLLRYRKGE